MSFGGNVKTPFLIPEIVILLQLLIKGKVTDFKLSEKKNPKRKIN